ncbi:YaaA family protein [Candidatus Tisiphia endosymbiont of Nemotelus uliginosus]|uniref:YaaA family protein n=2 Tax=Candidatus Tisiphia endosymbiont of Nemotelus uliginosus TaxID=3077926 RepID=UPI0035C894F0
MKMSDKIAELNYERFQNFDNQVSKQAVLAYTGDVYQNIDKQNFTQEQINFSQDHLLIISGLYGVLKPLDLIKPYRLEMSVTLPDLEKLANFWQDQVTTYINQILVTHSSKYLINLASNEYAIAINQHNLQYPIINIHFKEERNNKLQVIGINAKKASKQVMKYPLQIE